ncbi:reverse transcriptase domain-containing protein [Tanacetum coccineum]
MIDAADYYDYNTSDLMQRSKSIANLLCKTTGLIVLKENSEETFLANYLQQKKCIKDPVEIHHIKQREGEYTKDFVRRFNVESRDVKGAPEVMRISGFMHGITNPELIKRLHDKIPKFVEITTTFLRGENQQRSEKRQDRFALLSKTPKEILALEKGKFKAPPPMTTPVEKRNSNKFCEFHGEIKQNNGKDQQKANKKGETSGKDKALAILMVQPWQRVARQRITQSFSPNPEISFPPIDEEEGAEAKVEGHFIHRMYVDGRSALEIMYEHCFNKLLPEVKKKMVLATAPLIGFSGEIIWPLGQISLLVKIGDEEHSTSALMIFVVVRSASPYNGIIGRPEIKKIQAVPSTAHRMLKFPVEGGVLTIRSSKIVTIECTSIAGTMGQSSAVEPVVEERIKVAINPEYPEQIVMIGSTLAKEGRNKLCDPLRRNLDIFAWKPADMTGVSRHVAEHRLNVREGCPPIRQKKKGQATDRNKAIQEVVGKLVDAGILKEVHYHSWLSNPVMVKKHDGSWRMCVDFKDLNKACPKDGYPLPEIDWKVESLCGFPFKCFLDAYKGYHQIKMAKEDEEKTSFITSQGIYCYSKMPFGLRNARATYQRLVDKAFHKQIGRNLEVYVDDLVIKSRTEEEINRDIEETFKKLREINMKLNPKECTFRVEEWIFLGCKVNTKGMKVCPDKVDAVLSLPSQKCLKDVQKLNGKLASLNRCLAKSAEKSLPFFKTQKKYTKKSDFCWTDEAESAFKQMKQHIADLPILTAPEEKEELIVYLAAARETVSAVLMTEREAKQMPIYFVSRTLRGPEVNYTSMEKLVLTLVHASKRLKRYFQAHPIIVMTDQPIKQVFSKPKVAGRLQKWSIELGEYAIHYRPRISVKGQILADFIVERPKEDSVDTPMEIQKELPEQWILFTDGLSCADGSGAGLILTSPEGMEFTYALRFGFEATNNEAEYEALITGLRIAEQMGIKNLQANVDSRLVANQVNGTYIAKETDMVRYLEKVKTLTNGFRMFTIKQVPRSENKKADALSKISSTSFSHLSKQVLVEELKEKSINEVEVLAIVEEEGETWMTPIHDYITGGILPAEADRARAVKRKAHRYSVVNGILYKKSFLGPWLRCVGPLQANYVLREIHEGSCSMHAGTRSVVSKALQIGYYWPTMHKDARELIWACKDCQSSNGDTPFSLTYGTEAVIPAEIGMPTLRTTEVDVVRNDEALEVNLDLLEEKREQAAIREANSKRKMEKYYNAKVRNTSFKPGDLVYRNNDASNMEQGGKLGPKWERPYEVTLVLGKGAYKLRGRDGKQLLRTWNIRNLKKCYFYKT